MSRERKARRDSRRLRDQESSQGRIVHLQPDLHTGKLRISIQFDEDAGPSFKSLEALFKYVTGRNPNGSISNQ